MAKKVFDAVATTGTYTDRTGAEKKRYQTVGAVFEDDKGRMSLKIEAIPVGEWNGWVSFFTPKEKSTNTPAQNNGNSSNNSGGGNNFDEEIPFNRISNKLALIV